MRNFESLRKQRDFERLFSAGRRVADRWLVLISAPGQGERTRIAFVAGKRIGKAVVRNKVRRRLREAFRALSGLVLASSVDIVVLARGPAATATYHELATSLQRLLARAGILEHTSAPGAAEAD